VPVGGDRLVDQDGVGEVEGDGVDFVAGDGEVELVGFPAEVVVGDLGVDAGVSGGGAFEDDALADSVLGGRHGTVGEEPKDAEGKTPPRVQETPGLALAVRKRQPPACVSSVTVKVRSSVTQAGAVVLRLTAVAAAVTAPVRASAASAARARRAERATRRERI